MRTGILIPFFFAAGIVCQAGVITTTACTILDFTGSPAAAQTNTTSCSVSYTQGPTNATARASISGAFSATSLSFTGAASGFVTGSVTAQASFNETASL